jgi:NADPH:quinone reductase-like Zn-dependent oxidoreductase
MKAAVQTAYGAPDVVKITEIAKPVPKSGEVLVRIVATTVTSGDSRLRAFRIPAAFWLPARLFLGISKPRKSVLGSEFSGIVEAIGAGVTRLKTGDQVFGMHVYDAHAEYKAVPQTAAITALPQGMDFAEAAALPFGALTALHFLRLAKIAPGQKVLINGASGAVGSFAVQLARHFGAEVTGVCSARNLDMVRALGADLVIDYRQTDFSRNGIQYDVIMDTVDTVSFAQFERATPPTGQLIASNAGGGMMLRAGLRKLLGGRQIIVGVAGELLADIETLRDLAAAGVLQATIDSRVPFTEIVTAHALVDSGRKRGAVVVEVSAP